MSDQFDDEQFEREEKAFRASFGEVDEFEPLDPEQLKLAAKPRILWGRVIGAAAAAVVVFAGVGFGLTQLAGRGIQATVAEGAATAAASVQANDKGGVVSGAGIPAPEAAPSDGNYSSGSSSWQVTSKAPLARISPATGWLDGRISPATGWLDGRFYLIGGATPCGPTADCKSYRDGVAYDPSTDSWSPVAAPPVSLLDTTGVAFQGKLYFVVNESVTSALVLAYDPGTNSWTKIATPARLNSLIVASDQLIGVGVGTRLGGDATDRRYDPASNTWTALPTDPFTPDQTRSVVAVGDRLLLSAYTLSGAMKYATFDFATQTWTPLEDVTARGRMIAVGDWVAFQTDGSAMLDTYRLADGAGSGLAMDFGQDAIEHLKATGMLDLNGTVVGNRIVHYGELIDPGTNAMSLLPELPKAKLTGQVAIGSPDGLLVYRVTGVNDKAKATAYYLPVSP